VSLREGGMSIQNNSLSLRFYRYAKKGMQKIRHAKMKKSEVCRKRYVKKFKKMRYAKNVCKKVR
jgi:hypothetical protein